MRKLSRTEDPQQMAQLQQMMQMQMPGGAQLGNNNGSLGHSAGAAVAAQLNGGGGVDGAAGRSTEV